MGSWMMNCCLREAHDLGGCGAQLVREPRTSTMVAAPRRGPSSPALGLQRAYSASQRLISSTGGGYGSKKLLSLKHRYILYDYRHAIFRHLEFDNINNIALL